ncbi:uncharacterized protein [Lepidochelys kempii]|uniref:uncharacterized protein isoform X1 n=2 Tax=Lepidochelys kempii TaxID=8472 RepID=UPI003C6FF78A
MKKQLITHLVGFCWLICFKGTQHFSSAVNRCDDPMLCPDYATCINARQGYYCTCQRGFVSTSGATEFTDPAVRCNADACAASSVCPAFATCENIPGSHRCACKRGFASSSGEQYFTDRKVKCKDIDECSQDPSPCGPSSVCTNTLGSYACTCPPGYLPPSQPGIPFSCTDVDECARNPAICGPNASCLNTPGSYTCQCSPGHRRSTPGPWVPGTTLCTDVDECLDLASCPASATCTNTPGSHFCTCNTGFASSSGEQRFTEPAAQCNDIDECSRDPSPCGPSSVCTNTPGSYACTCPPGYLPRSQPGIPFSCTDVDECARNPAICGPNASCLNTPGSYTCQCSPGHRRSTPGPWVPGTTLCTDVDECLDLASCPASATCTNTPGSHFCTCNTGFASSSGEQRFTQPAAQCNDIDECSRDPSPCGPSSVCTNTVGSYACTCPPGYLPPSQPGIPFSCTDVDECARNPAICGPNASCLNTPGSYTCQCSPGHRRSTPGPWVPGTTLCTDIDECSRDPSPCGPSSVCTNTPGSYACTCPPGYLPPSQPGIPFSCTDVDECARNPAICGPNASCLNTPGIYTCQCSPGHRRSTPGPWVPGTTLCTDVDECLDLASCPASATCTNTPGSHFCTCNTGFASSSGEQRFTQPAAQCNDIDECSQDPSPCGPSSVCTNTPGSYTCMCPPGYLPPSQPGVPFSCTEVASNDPVRKCHNQRLDAAPGSSPDDAAFCTLLTSTFSVLGDPYERKNSTVSLVKAAAGFASILEQTPSWSNLSMEQLSTMATVFLQRVESVLLAAFANPTRKGSQTIQMEQLDVQTKVIEDGCPGKDSVISLEVKGETMKISCRTIQGTVAQARAGVAFASYMGMESILNGSFFHGQRATSVWMNSRVVSAVLTSQTKTDFPDPVNYTFQNLMPSSSPDQLICVSWEATAWRGSWSRAGCGVLHSNATHTTCSCNRVSNLAVLMASGEITAGFPLFLISHVGLALSLLCLFLTILTFLLSRSIRNVNTSIHLQLCLCLFLADLLFLTAVDSPSHQLACAVIAGLLHYLFLACFAWMFLEAVVLFLTIRNLGVVNYFSTHSPKMRHLSLFGYGFPTLVVAVSAAVMPQGYGRQENCWLSMEKGFIWSFLGPVCVIIGINSVLFALTLWMLQRKLSRLNTDVSTLKDTRLLTFKAIAQVFILGCTWIFGILQVGPAATVMAYLFTIVNSLQGAFIFLVHCLLNRQVREEYKRWFTCKPKSHVSDVSMSTLATSSKAG